MIIYVKGVSVSLYKYQNLSSSSKKVPKYMCKFQVDMTK